MRLIDASLLLGGRNAVRGGVAFHVLLTARIKELEAHRVVFLLLSRIESNKGARALAATGNDQRPGIWETNFSHEQIIAGRKDTKFNNCPIWYFWHGVGVVR